MRLCVHLGMWTVLWVIERGIELICTWFVCSLFHLKSYWRGKRGMELEVNRNKGMEWGVDYAYNEWLERGK